MSVEVIAYNYVSDVSKLLKNLINEDFAGDVSFVRFAVPSQSDKSWLPDKNINPENLWTWDEIYKNICDSCKSTRKRVLSPPDHLLILNSILKKVLAEYPDKLDKLPGVKRTGFLGVISGDIRELLNEDVKPELLEFNPESENASEFLLPRVYSEYVKYLENYNLLDSAAVYGEARNEIIKNQTWGRDFIFIFAGFLSFTHAQLELVRALGDRCKDVIILKPETNLPDFNDAHRQIFGIKAPIEKSKGHIHEIRVAEPGLEPEVIARNLALSHKYEYENFDDIGIMIDRGREVVFAEAFERYGVPYDFTSGIKINLTLPGKILSSIRHLNSRNWPAYETAMLLTQPCFAGIKFPVMKAYRAGCSGLDGWEEYLTSMLNDKNYDENIFSVALSSIKAIKKFRDVMAKGGKPERIMTAFHEFLTTEGLWLDRFNEKSIAGLPGLDETIRATANAIETIGSKVLALNELTPDLGSVQSDKLKDDEAYDFLERWCSNSDTRPPVQISNAVRIFTGTPPVLASFPIWIMTEITQKTWSGNVNSSPLLGSDERRKLIESKKAYLPTNQDKANQHEALFRRLIQVGEKITVISRPELDEEGRPLSESPFFEKFKEEMPWEIKPDKSGGIKILLGSDGFIFPEIDPDEKVSRKIPVVFKKANSVGASDIHKLLSCPFLWYQEKIANLYQQDTDIASQIEWGLMLHKFWERVWRRYRINFKDFRKIVNDEWKVLTETQDLPEDYKNYSRLVRDFRLKRKLDGIKYRVDRLRDIQDEILENLHNAGYVHEKVLLEDEAHLRTEINGINFFGQCDRIEVLRAPSGEKISFIADYKEGIGERSEDPMNKIKDCEWNKEKREKFAYGLQLSVYAALFEREHDIKLSGVYILGLEDGKISGSILKSEEFSEIFEIFSQFKSKKFKGSISDRVDEGEYAMACAVEILKSGKFEPYYQSDLCQFCKIKSLCRMGEFHGEVLTDSDGEE